MKKGSIICTIEEIEFFYYCWNEHYQCHIVYTKDENFHIDIPKEMLPTERDCQIVYNNYYYNN